MDTLENPLFTPNTNTYLTYIHLSNTFKKIGDKVFAGCENLKDIILSEDLTYIGKYAFENCKSLTTIEIPESVETLDEGAFAGCEKLEKFEGKFATYNGRALVIRNVLISVVPIDNSNTEGRIHKISEIDTAISYLGKSCFQGCKNMIRVDISPGVIEIGDYAFKDCEKLREIHFEGPNPPKIGKNIFENINSDFKIFVPEDKFNEYCEKFKNIHHHIYPKPNDNSIIYYGTITSEISHNKKRVTNNNYTNGNYYKISNIGTTLPTDYFKEQTGLTKVILGEGITKLSKNAFEKCINLEYIYLSDDILELNNRCFSGCTKLTRIHIPYGSYTQLTNIIPPLTNTKNVIGDFINPQKPITNYMLTSFGDEIFYGCSNLKEFGTYHKGCVSDDNKCYIQNSKLMFFAGYIDEKTENYIIPSNIVITSINKSAFKGTKKIKTIKLVESITTIGESAFEECTELEYIYNWNFVETISKKAFYNCTNIGNNIGDELSLPVKLTTIGESAFDGCVNLKKVSIPEDSILEEICEKSFYECINLIEINLPQSLKSIGMSAFEGCVELGKIDINKNIKKININTFYNCGKLTTVTIPEDSLLEEIYEKSFYGCTALTSINLPQSLKSIGVSAFKGCENMYINNIPETVTYIGQEAFSECKSLICVDNDGKEITLKLNITNIYNKTFYNCQSLTSVNIINSDIDKIYDSAFEGCVNLRTVSLLENSSLSMIGNSSFKNCTSLEYIYIPDTLTHIGMSAFENCTSYRGSHIDTKESIYLILNNISNLGDSCFKNSGINNLRIEDTSNILEIPISAFENCMQLEKVVISKKITTLKEKSFNGCKKLSSYNSSDVLNCINLLDSNVEVIEDYAFGNCDILNIYLNKSLKTLGNLCLSNTNSNKLTKIYINKNVNTPPKFSNEGAYPFGEPIFERFTTLPIIYVDNLLQKTLYQNDNDWRKYYSCFITNNDMEIIPTFPPILDWKPIDIPNKDGGTAIDPTTGQPIK